MNNDSKDRETILAETSRSIRAALHAQRQQLAARLRPDEADQVAFPRSVTMRLFMKRPAQSSVWLAAILRSRLGRSLVSMVALSLALRALRLFLMAPRAPMALAAPVPQGAPAPIAAPARAPIALRAAPRPR